MSVPPAPSVREPALLRRGSQRARELWGRPAAQRRSREGIGSSAPGEQGAALGRPLSLRPQGGGRGRPRGGGSRLLRFRLTVRAPACGWGPEDPHPGRCRTESRPGAGHQQQQGSEAWGPALVQAKRPTRGKADPGPRGREERSHAAARGCREAAGARAPPASQGPRSVLAPRPLPGAPVGLPRNLTRKACECFTRPHLLGRSKRNRHFARNTPRRPPGPELCGISNAVGGPWFPGLPRPWA